MEKVSNQIKISPIKYGDFLFKGGLFLFVVFTPISIGLTEGAFWLALIGYVICKVGTNKPLLPPIGMEKPIIYFIMALIFTSFFSIKPLFSLSSITAFRFFLLYYMVSYYDLDHAFVQKLIILIISMAVLWSAYEIFIYFQTQAHRLHPYTAHINVLVIPMVITLTAILPIKIRYKFYLLVSLFILSVASILSLSRAAWLGTLAAVAVVFFLSHRKLFMFFTATILLAVFTAAIYFPNSSIGGVINSTIKPFETSGARYGSNMERLHMLQDTVEILEKHPFVGIGPEAYRFVSRDKHRRISMDVIQILSTSGAIGLVAYIWLISAFIWRCYFIEKMQRKIDVFNFSHVISISIFAAWIGFLICGSFEPMFFSTKRFRFMMLLLGLNECLRTLSVEKQLPEKIIPIASK